MFYKKLILISSLIISAAAIEATQEEKKIFLDKFSSSTSKIKKDIKLEDKISLDSREFEKDINISKDISTDVKEIIANIKKDKTIEDLAKEDSQIIQTDKFVKQFDEAKKNLLYDEKLNWKEQNEIAQTHLKNTQTDNSQNFYFNSNETIYIFISSSLPKETIVNYLESTKYIQDNVVFVLQGGMKKLMPTMRWIKDLLSDKYANARIIIEPKLSKFFNIKKVPTLLYTQDNLFELQQDMKLHEDKDTYIFTGDLSFKYVLKKLNEEKRNDFLSKIIDKLEIQ